MATTKSPSKTAAKKVTTAAKKVTAKKPAAKKLSPTKSALDSAVKSSKLLSDAVGNVKKLADRGNKLAHSGKFPEASKALIDSRKKDLEALREASKKSYAGLQAVMKRNMEVMNEVMKEWQALGKAIDVKDPRKSYQNLDALSRKTFKHTLASMREMGEQAATSQAEALGVLKKRIKEDMEELKSMYKK